MAAHGFEPRTLRVWTECSSQLSYAAIMKITYWSWWPGLNWWPYPYQGYALPTELHQQNHGCGGWTWTNDLRVMSPTSYQLLHPAIKGTPIIKSWWRGKDSNLRSQKRQIYSLLPLTTREPLRYELLELAKGIEPSTYWLQVSCSTDWATPALH